MEWLSNMNATTLGILASVAVGFSTALGALPVFFTRKISARTMDGMLGFAAGVMLAATSFSLIIPSIEKGGGGIKGAAITVLGILLGGIFLDLVDKFSPHIHSIKGKEGRKSSLQKIWLFIIAITIHNFPEGLAVGVGFGDGDYTNGISLAIGISLQNIPEGLAVSLSLLRENYSLGKTFLVALLTGLVEPVGGILGVVLAQVAKPVLPLGLAFAAGAMLFVISDEIIPETHSRGFHRVATYGVLIGFVVMMFLDTALG
jgi:ZIP family zinc transporter